MLPKIWNKHVLDIHSHTALHTHSHTYKHTHKPHSIQTFQNNQTHFSSHTNSRTFVNILFLSTINAPFISILPNQSPNAMGRWEVPNRPPNLTSHAYLILMNGSVKHCTRPCMVLSLVKSSRIHQRGRQPCWKGSFFSRAFPSSLKHTHKEMLNVSAEYLFFRPAPKKKGPQSGFKSTQNHPIRG